LANVVDIACTCRVFWRVEADGVHYYAFWRHYLTY
jgi:hypothetical protein